MVRLKSTFIVRLCTKVENQLLDSISERENILNNAHKNSMIHVLSYFALIKNFLIPYAYSELRV